MATFWLYENKPTASDRLNQFCNRLKAFLPIRGNAGFILYKYPAPNDPQQNILMGYKWEVFKNAGTWYLQHDLIAFSTFESLDVFFPAARFENEVYIGGSYGLVKNKLINCKYAAAPLWPFVPQTLIKEALQNPDTVQTELISRGSQQPRTYQAGSFPVPYPAAEPPAPPAGTPPAPVPVIMVGPGKNVNKFLTPLNVAFMGLGLYLLTKALKK